MNARKFLMLGAALSAAGVPAGLLAQVTRPYDQTFLSSYSNLTSGNEGKDLIYIAPNGYERLSTYTAVLVDQPEILISADSDVKGGKPELLTELAEVLREGLTNKLVAGGYTVATAPGPGVLSIRTALTDIRMKKTKRGILGYTPIGFVVKAGSDALKDALQKVDIIDMTFQAQLQDSVTNEVLGAIVSQRGAQAGQKEQRIDYDEFKQDMAEWGARLSCRMSNSRLPEAQRINCADPKAREAAAAAKP